MLPVRLSAGGRAAALLKKSFDFPRPTFNRRHLSAGFREMRDQTPRAVASELRDLGAGNQENPDGRYRANKIRLKKS